MAVAIVTGSAGLIGSETVKFFCDKGFDVVGIDNNFRKTFFGEDASTEWNRQRLEAAHKNYTHYDADIRDHDGISKIYGRYGKDIKAVEKPRRPGDPPRLIASSDGIRNALGWKPRYQDIRTIVESAWAWHVKNPHGYGD